MWRVLVKIDLMRLWSFYRLKHITITQETTSEQVPDKTRNPRLQWRCGHKRVFLIELMNKIGLENMQVSRKRKW